MADIEFEDYTVRVTEALNEACTAFLHESAGEIKAQVIRNSRRDTSQTAGSFDDAINESELTATIGSPLENALWEEFGTGEFALNGDGRKTPWYVPVDGYTGKKKPTFNGKVVVVCGKDGKKFYKTNGKKPSRAFYKSFEKLKGKIPKVLESKLKGMK